MCAFDAFNPLVTEPANGHDANQKAWADKAIKREIRNILSSYVGWYDPFSELIQNALDAVEERADEERAEGRTYHPLVRVIVDLDSNLLTVTDNGIGMTAEEFKLFLTPNYSFKDTNQDTRGHKGVGASYLAYGFNGLRVHTKRPGFSAAGHMIGARSWTTSDAEAPPPLVEPDDDPDADPQFAEIDAGTTMTLRFDDTSFPSKLTWPGIKDADTWQTVLRVKTGMGQIRATGEQAAATASPVQVDVICVSEGSTTEATCIDPLYFWLRERGGKFAQIRVVESAKLQALDKFGDPQRVPGKFKELDFIWDAWDSSELPALLGEDLATQHSKVLEQYIPRIEVEYGYSAKLWSQLDEKLGVRLNTHVVRPGIQLGANRMPQGETVQVPLVRYVGRQNQVHFTVHFSNYTPDLGRKGFAKDLQDFATAAARAIVEGPISRLRSSIRKNPGTAPDLGRQLKIQEWKVQTLQHEVDSPLSIDGSQFFLPTRTLPITSEPTREQDVIALFHELLSGGVVRGLEILSTNERLTYDSLYRISFKADDPAHLIYDELANPFGIHDDVLATLLGKRTTPRILEYKFSLDGLIGDLDTQEKNLNDIDLCVAWEMGKDWKLKYAITSLIVPENLPRRESHGITHILQDPESGAHQCDLIILKDLVHRLQFPEQAVEYQRETYE